MSNNCIGLSIDSLTMLMSKLFDKDSVNSMGAISCTILAHA